MGLSVLVVDPCDGEAGGCAHCSCPASQKGTVACIISRGKDQNSKFEYGFYWMPMTFALS